MSRQIVASVPSIENRILLIRGHKVMLDSDLAVLYGVSTKRLNEQVKRNLRRFPADFMFQLSKGEQQALRSHSATLEKDAFYIFCKPKSVANVSGICVILHGQCPGDIHA